MSFNLASLALVDTFTFQLKHPADGTLLFADEAETEPLTITVYGKSSKQYRNAVTAMQNRTLRRNHKKEVPTVEALLKEGTDLLVACSASAANLTLDDQQPINDEASFRKLYTDPRFSWVKDQADEALGDISNFLAQ